MSIEKFVGTWMSHDVHTNPYEEIPGVSDVWVARKRYYPPKGLELVGTLATGSSFEVRYEPPNPQQAPAQVPIIKFTFPNYSETVFPNVDPNLISQIEAAEYHIFGEYLVSPPIQIGPQTSFVEVLQVIKSSILPTGEPTEERTVMRHMLIWSDGLRARWPCCFVKK
jgi:hypothetical protein